LLILVTKRRRKGSGVLMKFIGKNCAKSGIIYVYICTIIVYLKCLTETKAFLDLLNLAFLVHLKTKIPFFSLETIHESK
jgi:hypothetical protein